MAMQLSLFSEPFLKTTRNDQSTQWSSLPKQTPAHTPCPSSPPKNKPFPNDLPESHDPQIEQKALLGLAQCARGYIVREIKENYEIGPDGQKILRGGTITRKRIGPDLAAIQFILTNLNPGKWRLKPAGIDESREEDPDLSMFSEKLLTELAGGIRTESKNEIAQNTTDTKHT